MDIKSDTKNELFKRQELILEVEGDKNPGFAEVRKQIAEEIGKPEENIEVRKVEGSFGQNKFHVEAYVYDSKENLDSMVKLSRTKKERDEAKKPVEDEVKPAEESVNSSEDEVVEEKPAEGAEEAPTEEKPVEET